jgi:uncharacterized membrane protein YhaH (DUF805 family)
MAWYLLAWQRATDFSGRSRRKEYWYFQLFNAIVMIFLGLFAVTFSDQNKPAMIPFGLMFAYGLVLFVPSLAITVRRLHDIGKSGWWYLIAFVPLIGGLVLFVFTLLDSDPARNEYGPNPKVPGQATVII